MLTTFRDYGAVHMKLAITLMAIFAVIAVSGAPAADFETDVGTGADCTEPPGGGQLIRCPTAYVGEAYEIEMESEEGSGCTTTDGSNPYTWYEVVNSALPPGLSMTRAGVISGTPTSTGFYRFWVWNHDVTAAEGGPSWCVNEDRSEVEFSIYVDPGLLITTLALEPVSVGQRYSETLTSQQVTNLNPVTGSEVQATWSLASGVLPPGLALSPAGVLSGTPTAEGSFQFTVRASTGSPSATKTYTLSVRQPLVVQSPFTPAVRPTAEVGIRYGKNATASGGSGTYTWSLASGSLPAGLTLNTSSGAISGTPQVAGNSAFVLAATDSEGRVATSSGSIGVAAKLTLTTARLKAAKVGRAYVARLATSGGVRPVKWKLSGKLPAGLRFAKATGTIAGTPRKAGTFRLTAEATDALGAKTKKALTLTVSA